LQRRKEGKKERKKERKKIIKIKKKYLFPITILLSNTTSSISQENITIIIDFFK
jgi:hypothetical protein